MTARTARDWLDRRGLENSTPESLNASLRAVLARESGSLYGRAEVELTAAEIEVLREGGIDFEREVTHDPFEGTVVLFAALLESSLNTAEAAERLGLSASQVRQMIARRTLYSVKLDGRRYVPQFQFRRRGPLVPNIRQVNAALPTDLHPTSVYDWYTRPDAGLVVDEDDERGMTPLEWLDTGGDPATLVAIVKRL